MVYMLPSCLTAFLGINEPVQGDESISPCIWNSVSPLNQCTLCLDVFKFSTLSSPYSCTCSFFFCYSYIDCTLQHYYISTRRFRIRELACQISNAIHNSFTLHATSCFKGHNTVCSDSFSIRLLSFSVPSRKPSAPWHSNSGPKASVVIPAFRSARSTDLAMDSRTATSGGVTKSLMLRA